ncbi:MAG: M20/M25/M40 family metallo-hydrolase [Acidobacteria bacterium]|jgi:glutamate carboxypeptidase|nr:M20/M25/M40 family metallo-hydrolase [Acidobacteriota bacterium]
MHRTRQLLLILPILAAPAWGGDLTPAEQRIVNRVDADREWTTDLLARSVNIMSATENHEGIRHLADFYAGELDALGFASEWIDQSAVDRAGHLVAERKGSRGRRLLLIGHLDTVLEGEPFRREGSLGYGSGTADMKGGNAIVLAALKALHDAGELEGRQVIVIFTGDEEATGKPYPLSRAALLDVGKRSDVALAFEGSVPGTAVVGRRGFSSWQLEVTGSQGHSSTIFGEERGSGAIFEAARILSAFHDGLRRPNITYNPSVIVGGTDVEFNAESYSGTAHGKSNVVPGRVVVSGDLRYLERGSLEATREKMRAIVANNLSRTSATISFLDGMPAMEPTDGNMALLAMLDQISRDLGAGPVEAHDPSQRGAGDISFVAGDVDGLDGLGALGNNDHAHGENLDLDALPVLVKRAALLMHRLQ